MTGSTLGQRTLADQRELLSCAEITPSELIESTFAQIDTIEPGTNAYISLRRDEAVREAKLLERDGARDDQPLWGIPISIKDNIDVRGLPTTAGAPTLRQNRPSQDAYVVDRLRAAGAIIVGKCNMHEFAFAAPNPEFGPVTNPWNPHLTVGGSSSGSAAAVSANMCAGSIGTDTGGSIRIPASFCGVVGLKPTFGLINRRGVVPVSRTLDHVGPFARTVDDVAILLAALTDRQPRTLDPRTSVNAGVYGMRLGTLSHVVLGEVVPEVFATYAHVCSELENAGARLQEVAIPDLELARSVFRVIATAELAEQQHDAFVMRRSDFGKELASFLEAGEALSAVDYLRARRLRILFCAALKTTFKDIDCLVLPTVPVPPYREGNSTVTVNCVKIDAIKAMTQYTTLFNLSGYPAVSVPVAIAPDNAPIGMQVVGRRGGDLIVLRTARSIEQFRPSTWSGPPLVGDEVVP